MLLRELGVGFELVLVDRTRGDQRSDAYLAKNPKGAIPTLEDDGWVLTEAAAICAHLVEAHAVAPWGRPADARARTRLLEWLFYLSNTVQPESMLYHYPERHLADGVAQRALRARAEERLGEMFTFVDRVLGDRPFLLGTEPSAADLYLLMMARWARSFASPPRSLPHLGVTLSVLLERSAVRATFVAEGIGAPYV
jgi:glutathione S-transferase